MNVNSLNNAQNFSALKNLQENSKGTNQNFEKQKSNFDTQKSEPAKQMVNAQTALANYTSPKVNLAFKGNFVYSLEPEYTFDEIGNVKSITCWNENGEKTVTTLDYDQFGNEIKTIKRYDQFGNEITSTNNTINDDKESVTTDESDITSMIDLNDYEEIDTNTYNPLEYYEQASTVNTNDDKNYNILNNEDNPFGQI